MFGAGGGTSSYEEIEKTDVILLWGSNAREAHPIFFHHLLKGVRNGARLIGVDPRRTSSVRWADTWAGLDVGSDIALANAIGREILAAGLENREFIPGGAGRTERVPQKGDRPAFPASEANLSSQALLPETPARS